MRDKNRNHKDECKMTNWQYSGTRYNRVKLCECGAEDYAPDRQSIKELCEVIRDAIRYTLG